MNKIPSIFGAAVLAVAMVAAPAAQSAPKEKVIYSFTAGNDGAQPQSGVIRDAEGNLYGTAQDGAGQGCGGGGCGTVFKLTAKGKETTLHVFTGDDGAFPIATLVADAAGNLYGTAIDGGPRKHCACGVVFKITPDGQFSIVHAFKGGADGAHPVAGLIFDKRGNLFGTTVSGGNDCNGTGQGCGTVFKLAPDGTATVLHTFEGESHGAYPSGGVIVDDAGTLYGTTNNGGVDCDGSGCCGTVYALTPDGTETGLHSFAGGSDGSHPRATLVRDGAGRMYGTTVEGGGENDGGVVFEIKPNGKEKIVYAFTGGNDGGGPFAALTMDGTGELYGTTFTGGLNSFGTVFKLKP